MKGTLTAVELSRVVDEEHNISELILTIDFDEVYAYQVYEDIIGLLQKEVEYITRIDFVNGIRKQVLCNINLIGHVYAVESTELVKLYTGDTHRPYCNFKRRELKFGEVYPGCVAYLSDVEEGASLRAHWFDCVCLDEESKTFILRIFARKEDYEVNQEKILRDAIGTYIQFDLEVTRFGIQTHRIEPLPWNGGTVSPEVGLARAIVEAELSKDVELQKFIDSANLIDVLYDRMDGEPGFGLVRMAAEMYFINALENVTGEVNINAMKRAVFCSRLHVLSKNTKWSKATVSINRILRNPELSKDKDLMLVVDVLSDEPPTPTKIAYIQIRKFVDLIIKIRRGEDYEKDFLSSYNSVMSEFGGLL